MAEKRILGLDFGSRTCGVAVSDPLLLTAQGVETITRPDENKLRRTCARIGELIARYDVGTIVLGYPKNMNNTEGERVEKTLAFRDMLVRRTGLPVELWDERLSTVAADRVLMESGVRRENRKAVVDKIAAQMILQGYLDLRNARKEQDGQEEQKD
jgi:putative Holliday junction resolvase